MSDVTFEQVLELAEQLTPEERARLVERLQETQPRDYGITREQLLAEMEELHAAGAFDNVESLYGKYADPSVKWEEGELEAYLHEIRTEWEKEIDEIIADD